VERLRACDIDSEQMIIGIVEAKGRKDRNVVLPAETLDLLRRWWKRRPTKRDAGVAPEPRWLFPVRIDRHPTTARQFGRLFKEAAKAAGLRKAVSLHSPAPFLRNPSARGRQGHSPDPGAAGNRHILWLCRKFA
jgi:integrase/recombinase XerD